MWFNIMSEELFTNELQTIECKQISSDSHSIDNLFSDDVHRRRLGFRTEPFVRPPIEITLRSRYRFNLKELEIGLKLNDNQSSSLEIYSATDSQDYRLIARQYDCRPFDALSLKNVCFRLNSTLSALKSTSSSSTTQRRDNCPPEKRDTTRLQTVKCFKNCFQLNAIKIKILRTANSSVPCLSYLNIWCQPIGQTDPQILRQIVDIISKQNAKNSSKRFNFYNSGEESNDETINESHLNSKRKFDSIDSQKPEDEFPIPDEFIDSITNEVMIDPILLPSGHCVDKTTLDRYLSEESKWCRRPSDPFTQMHFTSERQPKPNVILKQRIDEFLSQLSGQSTADERLEPSNKRRIVGYNCVSNGNKLISSKLLINDVSAAGGSGSRADQLVNKQEKCVECGFSHSGDELQVLYRLLCNHLICRKQLLTKLDQKLSSIVCNECKRETQKQMIVKLNHI